MDTKNPIVPTRDTPNAELTRREFIDRAKKVAVYAVPAVTILAASKQAIAFSGGE